MTIPDPFEKPVTFGEDAEAVQAKVVPATPGSRARDVVKPLHPDCEGGEKDTDATGQTVTV